MAMKETYILAIDQGTTSTRSIIFNRKGQIMASSQMEIAQICPNNGWVEQNPEEIFETVIQTIKDALNQAHLSIESIEALGITNQRETTILWDKITGKPLYHAIVWQSRQSTAICEEWISKGYQKTVHQKTGLMINPYFSASKIRWILDHVPGSSEKAKRGEILFGTVETYLLWRLTKGKHHITDYSNASRTMVFNINTLNWDEELLALFDFPLSLFPQVVDSACLVGGADGLREFFPNAQVKIASLVGDQQAALFGQCCFDKGSIKSTYGTGCFILMNTKEVPIYSQAGLLTTIAWGINGKIEYALEGSVFVAGAAVQWLRDGLKFFPKSSDCEEYLQKNPDSGGVYMVPAFVGLGTPYWDNDARGAIFGLTRATTKENVIAAVIEGIAYQAKDVMDVMKKEAGFDIQYLGVDGGASVNNFLMQFQADLLNVKLVRPRCLETTALGAFYLAALAIGWFKSTEEIKKYHQVDRLFLSHMTEEERERRLKGWQKAVQATMTFK